MLSIGIKRTMLGGLVYLAGPSVVYTVVALLLASAAVLMLLTRATRQDTPREPASWRQVLDGLLAKKA